MIETIQEDHRVTDCICVDRWDWQTSVPGYMWNVL